MRKLLATFYLLPALASAACPTLLDYRVPGLSGGTIDMCAYQGKAVVVVNTASHCGFTPQFKGLQSLWQDYRDKGLVVVGFPSDDFFQELAQDKEVASFCQANYGVSFPMASRVHVRGDDAHPLYQALAKVSGSAPKWNFYKYVIAADGKTVTAFSPLTKPDAPDFLKAVDAALPKP
ncbi:glutathione peroxidase [Vogesella sp. LIG4]|uniref:glutathione peroxidase n=1 Tax=Vogesella sp. LIG4 TaxID=1192162 RepID=UPI00081FF0E5|nr:redoxin domain-containing protein [Vogesella sp. LIG4]SCK07437.1 glutathione peroxidase [Vogesella sp. LIG4]